MSHPGRGRSRRAPQTAKKISRLSFFFLRPKANGPVSRRRVAVIRRVDVAGRVDGLNESLKGRLDVFWRRT